MVFDQTSAGTYSGNMSGSGSLTKIGADVLTVWGNKPLCGRHDRFGRHFAPGRRTALPTEGGLTVNSGTVSSTATT